MDLTQNDLVQKIEIFIQCRGLQVVNSFTKPSPHVVMQSLNSNTKYVQKTNHVNTNSIDLIFFSQWSEHGKTEIIQENTNPNFVKTIILDYFFEKQQYLKFDIVNNNTKNSQQPQEIMGSCQTTLGALVGAKNQTLIFALQNQGNIRTQYKEIMEYNFDSYTMILNNFYRGKIVLRAEKVMQCMEYLQMQWNGVKLYDTRLLFGKTCPFLKFYKISETAPPLLIYQSEIKMHTLNPVFKEIEFNLGRLASGDVQCPVLVELWDYRSSGKHILMGSFRFSTRTLIAQKAQLEIRPGFLDFIRGGTQLALITAVDFTASNGDPDIVNSLHSLHQSSLNQYQAAIASVGQVLLQYDHDKMVPMYGFGGKPQMPNLFSDKVFHCFPMNGNQENPEVYGMKGILDCYKYAVNKVIFSGPTLFAPLIKETMKISEHAKLAQQKNPEDDQYYVLLILTDGQIDDMENTKRCLINSSHLPLSIIIIGIGDADFENMDILDDDNCELCDSDGNKSQRDLVQFVPFNKYKENPQILSEQVLEELPRQLEEYMKLVNRKPKQPQPFQQFDDLQSQRTMFDAEIKGNIIGNDTGSQYFFQDQQKLKQNVDNIQKEQKKQFFPYVFNVPEQNISKPETFKNFDYPEQSQQYFPAQRGQQF